MGGMQTWMWAQKYPDSMDTAAPMASLPTQMIDRNWMTRRLIIDSIRNDPAWMNGNYTAQHAALNLPQCSTAWPPTAEVRRSRRQRRRARKQTSCSTGAWGTCQW
jgi:homoserine acetyltransferase